MDLRHRLFAPLELVHLLVVQAVVPVLPSLLFLGVLSAFLVLLFAGALVLLPAVLLPAGALVLLPAVLLPEGLLVVSVAALLPEDFLAVPGAAAVPPLLVAGPVWVCLP